MSKPRRTSAATRRDALGFALAVALLGPGVIALHTLAAKALPHPSAAPAHIATQGPR